MRFYFTYVFFGVLIILISRFQKGKVCYLITFLIGTFFYSIFSFLELTHFLLYNDRISPSTFYIIFETNKSEITEFLSIYFSLKILIIGVLFLITFCIGIIFSYLQLKVKCRYKKLNIKFTFISLIMVSSLLVFFHASFFPFIGYNSYVKYQIEKEKLQLLSLNKKGGVFNEVYNDKNKTDEVYVLIIGESTTSHHMELYDYYRKTNPKLSEIRNELIVYKDVISPNAHSIPSLNKSLSLADYKNPERINSGSLIQLFNKAGFYTYWISNQQPIGIFETTVTAFSKSCYEQVFINTSGSQYDEKLLKPFKKALIDNHEKKLIVIHLMGTHVDYSRRYPKTFNLFKTKPKTKFKHEKAYELINAYDNAVLYNDYVLKMIIEELKKCRMRSFALYFSDHGEDVYETTDMAAHLESKGTKPMYDIPLIMWLSSDFYDNKKKYIFDTKRKYNTEDLIYTMADLAGISFSQFDSSKSLVNQYFDEKNRIILNEKDYEDVFNSKK